MNRPLSYINYKDNLLAISAQHGCCFQTFMGTIVCDPYDGKQHLLLQRSVEEAKFLDSLKSIAAANDWHAYYATRSHALTLIPFWVWCHIWYGYSTIWCFAMTRRKIDMEYRHYTRR